MSRKTEENRLRNRKWLLRAMGTAAACLGIFAAVAAVLELKSYALFEPGGRYGYEGFGPGSFMHGLITLQAAGYALIAAILIPLGWGHIRLRPWTAKLSRALLWTWIAYGIPVALVCLFLAAAFKGLSSFALTAIVLCLAFACFGLPPLLLKFYKNSRTVAALKPDSKPQRVPEAALTLILLAAMNCLLFASMRLFGFFPAFGVLLTGRSAAVAVMFVVLCFAVTVWNLRRVRRWALWSFAGLSLILCASVAVTLSLHSYASLLAALSFAPEEMAYLKPIPLQGFHLALFTGLPLPAGAAAAFFLRKRFYVS